MKLLNIPYGVMRRINNILGKFSLDSGVVSEDIGDTGSVQSYFKDNLKEASSVLSGAIAKDGGAVSPGTIPSITFSGNDWRIVASGVTSNGDTVKWDTTVQLTAPADGTKYIGLKYAYKAMLTNQDTSDGTTAPLGFEPSQTASEVVLSAVPVTDADTLYIGTVAVSGVSKIFSPASNANTHASDVAIVLDASVAPSLSVDLTQTGNVYIDKPTADTTLTVTNCAVGSKYRITFKNTDYTSRVHLVMGGFHIVVNSSNPLTESVDLPLSNLGNNIVYSYDLNIIQIGTLKTCFITEISDPTKYLISKSLLGDHAHDYENAGTINWDMSSVGIARIGTFKTDITVNLINPIIGHEYSLYYDFGWNADPAPASGPQILLNYMVDGVIKASTTDKGNLYFKFQGQKDGENATMLIPYDCQSPTRHPWFWREAKITFLDTGTINISQI